jgi:hypothetical protein
MKIPNARINQALLLDNFKSAAAPITGAGVFDSRSNKQHQIIMELEHKQFHTFYSSRYS